MNYCRFRNDFIKRMANAGGATPILPPEYQQVEYLQSSGGQIINSGIYASNTLQVSIEFELHNYTYGNLYHLFGSYRSHPNTVTYSVSFPSPTTIRLPYNTQGDAKSVTITNVSTGKHLLIYRFGAQILDGTTVSTESGYVTNNINVGLFGRIAVNVSEYTYSTYRGYRIKLGTSSEESRYADFIPCYRKSDNKPGMYDLVTNTFFTNAGTGEFTVGQDV